MMRAIGIDGCRSGWIAVWIEKTGRRGFEIFPKIEGVRKFKTDMAMIDIPIGLPQSGDRACDKAARKMLGRAWPRVFTGVRRPLLAFLNDANPASLDDFRRANEWARLDGKRFSYQMFCILPKIKEVDHFLVTDGNQNFFRETHPELVFHRLNGGVWLPNKQKREGEKQRRDLLAQHGFEDVDVWLSKLTGSGAKRDDLLDACACAIAACPPFRKLECDQESDARGLRMEMWF